MNKDIICEICGADKGRMYSKGNKFNKNLCNRHYTQLRIYGKILKIDDEYINDKDHILIKIVNGWSKSNKVNFSKIDKEDEIVCRKYKWHISATGYLATAINKKIILFHQLILDYDKSKLYCDHVNRDKLDNRRKNLRIVTNQENIKNQKLKSNNTTGYKGVEFFKPTQQYRASITNNYKTYYNGYYDDIEDAIKARKELELKYWGKLYE